MRLGLVEWLEKSFETCTVHLPMNYFAAIRDIGVPREAGWWVLHVETNRVRGVPIRYDATIRCESGAMHL